MRGSSIEGMWVILVDEGGEKVPMLARAGSGLYLLAFGNGHLARKFVAEKQLHGAEPRMVVAANISEFLAFAARMRVTGVLVDYDAATNTYREAGLVY